MKAKLSAIIATRDRPSHLRDCMISLNKQTVIPEEVVVVDASSHRDSEEMVRGLADIVGFRPFAELTKYYKKADMLVVPSRNEAFPRVILEAMAYGCPVIVSGVGGIPYCVKSESNGIVVWPEDHQQIADAVERMCRDKDLRDRLVLNGVETTKNMTIEKQVKSMVEVINSYYESQSPAC